MTWRATTWTAAPTGHHGTAHIETFDRRADAEAYRSRAQTENPTATTHVTGQHEPPTADLDTARRWMTYLVAVWAAAPHVADHKHQNGWQWCVICNHELRPVGAVELEGEQ